MFLCPGIGFYRAEQCLWVYVSYLNMGFLDIGIKKHPGQHRQENLWLLSKVNGDCTDWPLTTCSWARISRPHLQLAWRAALILYDKVLNSSSREIYLNLYIGNMPTPTATQAFVGYLSFVRGKVRVSRFTQKPFGSKNVLKPTLDMKQQVFPRSKLKKKTIDAVNKWVKQE